LNVLSIVVPVFSMYSLYYFIQHTWTRYELMNLFKKSVFPLAGFLLLLLVGSPLFDMKSSGTDSDWSNNNTLYAALLDARTTYLRSDTLRSLVILVLGASLLYAVALKKVKVNDFLMGFGLLILLDLWIVAKRYVHAGNFQNETYEESNFQPRVVDDEIRRDTNLSYRVFDKSVSTFNSAIPSYFHKTIGGDHPAKLRRYQDMIDYYFSKNNTTALNMFNTKYIIEQDGVLHTNPGALGNAWFVSRVKKVNSPDEEIKSIESLDPAEEVAFLESEFKQIKTASSYQKNGSITLVHYDPNHLTYQSASSGAQLSVYSEVWYGPDKGWEAMIDGKPAEYFRVDYILRALMIPSGDHQIEFIFNPKKFIMNQTISFYSGMLFGLLLLAGLVLIIKEILNRPLPEIKVVELETKPTPLPSNSKPKKR
jgi:Bacterial membrane protein YfhO